MFKIAFCLSPVHTVNRALAEIIHTHRLQRCHKGHIHELISAADIEIHIIFLIAISRLGVGMLKKHSWPSIIFFLFPDTAWDTIRGTA
jgi:hypothetical protein